MPEELPIHDRWLHLEEEMGSVKTDVARLFTAVEGQGERLTTAVQGQLRIEQKLDNLARGPELAKWSGWAALILGACWYMIQSDTAMARLQSEVETARLAGRVDEMGAQVATVARDVRFQWDFSRAEETEADAREKERLAELDRRIVSRFERNESVIERGRKAREGDLESSRREAAIDKDEIERSQNQILLQRIRELEDYIYRGGSKP